MSYSKIFLLGRLGGDPEMRYMPNGDAVTNFSLATSNVVSKEKLPECPNGWKESYNKRNWEVTTWWRVTCWRGLAETANSYLSKGREVFIEAEIGGEATNGNLNPRIWTGSDGEARASFEVTARSVHFVGGEGDGGRAPQKPAESGAKYAF
jgi:single-strand DNA-binding protein